MNKVNDDDDDDINDYGFRLSLLLPPNLDLYSILSSTGKGRTERYAGFGWCVTYSLGITPREICSGWFSALHKERKRPRE